jgi:hypothetical protein
LDTTEGNVSPTSLVFAPGEVRKAVTMTGVDDTVMDGDIAYTISLGPPMGDSRYVAEYPVAMGLQATNLDDDWRPAAAAPVGRFCTYSPATATIFIRLPQRSQISGSNPCVRPYYASSIGTLLIGSNSADCRPQSVEDTSILQHCRLPTLVRTAVSLPLLTK